MREITYKYFILLFILIVGCSSKSFPWSEEKFEDLITLSDKIIMIDFYADW